MNENKLLIGMDIALYHRADRLYRFSLCFIFLSQFYRVRLDEPAGI